MEKQIVRFYDPETRTYSIRLEGLTMKKIEAVELLLGIKTRSPNR